MDTNVNLPLEGMAKSDMICIFPAKAEIQLAEGVGCASRRPAENRSFTEFTLERSEGLRMTLRDPGGHAVPGGKLEAAPGDALHEICD